MIAVVLASVFSADKSSCRICHYVVSQYSFVKEQSHTANPRKSEIFSACDQFKDPSNVSFCRAIVDQNHSRVLALQERHMSALEICLNLSHCVRAPWSFLRRAVEATVTFFSRKPDIYPHKYRPECDGRWSRVRRFFSELFGGDSDPGTSRQLVKDVKAIVRKAVQSGRDFIARLGNLHPLDAIKEKFARRRESSTPRLRSSTAPSPSPRARWRGSDDEI
jgi:hypothetical protein